MAADRLTLYNDALLICGERFLSSLTEEREPRRLLDQAWNGGAIRWCLERGQWNFATRTIQIDYDSGIEPDFGYSRAFDKPTDWVNTRSVCSDEFFRVPLLRYVDEADYWFSDLDTIYVRYISDDASYGMNLGRWPDTFKEVVAYRLASKIILKLSNSDAELLRMQQELDKKLREAKNSAAQAEPTQFPAMGNWSRARNRFPNRRDGGNTSGNLIG